ncbi:DUF6894 family protein [Devosia submarina]|uniref:DUF6894 family protein n=1 Tax=Devosia submarina TaxID=1173082 RepID=UPI000D341E74|nr:hypothetical protein [Devosia submarina]
MSVFYFDVVQNGDLEIDHVGIECRNIEHAQAEAQRAAMEMAMELGASELVLKIVVADQNYRQVLWLTIMIASGEIQPLAETRH